MTDGRRNIRTTTPTKVPGLPKPPANIDRSLRDYLVACGEALEIRLGRKGDVRDRAITLRELIDSGLAKELRNKKFDPNDTGNGLNVDFGGSTTFSETPVTPVSFTATAGYSVITLKWEGPFYKYQGHSFTEVWRHTANTLADATFIGSSSNIYYIDAVGSGSATYYYWIRHVNTANEVGPWSNNGVGVSAATQTDVATLLSTLSSSITNSQLANSLLSTMPGQGSNTTVAMYDQQYTLKIQTVNTSGKYVSGFGLANSVASDGTPTSAFIVAADKFAIINPSSYSTGFTNSPAAGNVPFAVTAEYTDSDTGITVPAGTYIKSAFIDKATIHNLVAGSVVGDYIKASVVMDAPHMHVGTINIGTINKTDADNPRTWSHSVNGSAANGDRISNFSVDANGYMQAESAKVCALTIYPTKTDLVNNTNIVFDSNGLDGTYIKDATVDTLEIAGNAVTVSVGASGSTSLTLTNSYQQVATVTVSYSSGKAPTGVIMIGGVAVLGDTTTAQTVNVQVRRIYSGGGWNGVNIGQSFASSFGGSAVVSGYQDISTSGAGTSFTVELYASSSVSSNCRTLSKYFLSAIAAKR